MYKSDHFVPVSITQLWKTITHQLERNHIFGIHDSLFFKSKGENPFSMIRYGKLLETPFGVAAGPHTQLSQNIISAWLCGARYFELKTIQTLDELVVSKPCIDMQDEGYNCEWSQELKIKQSFDEYLNAWILIHVLKHKLSGQFAELGAIFNISAGYNLEGIQKENVQWFFDKIRNCKTALDEKKELLRKLYPAISEIDIPAEISDNITLSTMHGCPPEEIEKIGLYLINEKKFHTTIKLNPTLLGKDELRNILNQECAFNTEVPDEAFEHDLKYPDALKILKNLKKSADNQHLHMGIKLTNTLESANNKNVFNASEKMMYMSGRALHPISIALAAKLQQEHAGELDISFSAGADCFNIADIVACGLKPVTVCSDVLKPGGYGRMKQYADNLDTAFVQLKAESIDSFIIKNNERKNNDIKKAALENLSSYERKVRSSHLYKKDFFFEPNIKNDRKLSLYDCVEAPCVCECPTHQDIPQYLYHTSRGEYSDALGVILRTNPFPNTLGLVCDHACQLKCTRTNYDSALLIRDVKRFIAERTKDLSMAQIIRENGVKVAIIGAGPSGLSCAYFLRLHGFEVDVFESKYMAGGMVSAVIPRFRLSAEAFEKDFQNILQTGVRIHYGSFINKSEFEKLKKKYSYVFVAIGAQKMKKLGIEGEGATGVVHPLMFLQSVKEGKKPDLGKHTIVVGGGNTAIDIARTAKRLVGDSGKVSVLYRRTLKEMPAESEEIKEMIKEGIQFIELAAPKRILTHGWFVNGLECVKMYLSEKDSSGRRKPLPISKSDFIIPCNTIIAAIGQEMVLDFLDKKDIEGLTGYETLVPNVFIGGDAYHGPSNMVTAVADGRKVAENIIMKANLNKELTKILNHKDIPFSRLMEMRSNRVHKVNQSLMSNDEKNPFALSTTTLLEDEAKTEASRCLYCDEICNICVTVCPNRANQFFPHKATAYKIHFGSSEKDIKEKIFRINQPWQVFNIADFCNECGNCTTFCPTSGKPFSDKPKLFLNKQAYSDCKNGLYYQAEMKTMFCKSNELEEMLILEKDKYIYKSANVEMTLNCEDLGFVGWINVPKASFDSRNAVTMKLMFDAVHYCFGL